MQVLAIARIRDGTSIEQILPLIKPEAAQVWEFYATGKPRTIYHIAGKNGAVMIWDVSSVEEVEAELQKFPLVEAGILACEVIPLKP